MALVLGGCLSVLHMGDIGRGPPCQEGKGRWAGRQLETGVRYEPSKGSEIIPGKKGEKQKVKKPQRGGKERDSSSQMGERRGLHLHAHGEKA